MQSAAVRPAPAPKRRARHLPHTTTIKSTRCCALGRRLLRNRVSACLACLLLLVGTGCATTSTPSATRANLGYPSAVAEVQEGNFANLEAFRTGWLAQPDAAVRLERLSDLDRQALQMYDQPLRLGAIGAALLELNPASLMGHIASNVYYERVANSEDAKRYLDQATAIATQMRVTGRGTQDAPFKVLTPSEASAYLRHEGVTSLGSVYAAPRTGGLHLSMIGSRASGKPLVTTTFDVSASYFAENPDALQAKDANAQISILQRYLGERLRKGDSAAQTFFAMNLLAAESNYRSSAIQMLQQAVGDGNLYARLVLVQSMLADYGDTPEEQRKPLLEAAARQLEQAVAAGSEAALLELGRLQLSGLLGEEGAAERKAQGVANIVRSANLEHVPAMLALAGLYAQGTAELPKDVDQARAWLLKAAQLGDTGARIGYARFLLAQTPAQLDEQANKWLLELSDAGNPDAMLMVAALHARGELAARDLRLARKLMQKIVVQDPTSPEPVNNVAWTLAVTDIPDLRDPREALEIMSTMMKASKTAASNPAYLDTWAAVHAANGKFEAAVEMQEAAVKAAEAAQDEETAKLLREHLEAFKRGETITEKVP